MKTDRRKISAVADLIRRGGVLLREACPRCGGVMVKYMDQKLCVDCGSLADLKAVQIAPLTEVIQGLRFLVSRKIEEVSQLLSREIDVEKQVQMATLLQKYMDILDMVMKAEERGRRGKSEVDEKPYHTTTSSQTSL